MLRKYATATVISAEIAERNAVGLVRTAHRAVFNYEPKPGFLYVRSRMISSRCNDNHDEFPAEEIRKAWKTAIGKPVFVNHRNEDHRRMRGVIIDAALHEDVLPDGKPDVWIEALHEIDAQRFPKLAKAILEGRVNRTSMGTDVGFSVCSACGNKASTPAEYCQHIPQMKGKILYRHTASGQREGHLIRETCYKLGFFENSFLVEDPADPTAVVTGVDDRGLKATASLAKEAAPKGLRFHFTPAEYHESRSHHLTATLPGSDGRREVGYLQWHPGSGTVMMVNTDPGAQGQGIASALWHRAHEVAGQQDLTPPKHSDVQTPDGMQWARKVDQQPINAPGPGQQSFFEPTPEQGGTEVAGVPRPAHDDLFDHLLHDHAEWGRADVERMRDRNSLESAHQRLHADPGMFPGRQFHIHGMRSSLPKLADYHIPCERPGCGMHWGPHGAAGLLIRHHDPEDGQTRYLLQKRAPWVDHGGTWGIPGGALHEDESPEEGAEREAEEEMGELPYNLRHHRTHTDDHGGWAYHTVVLDSPERFHPGGGGDHSYGDDDDYHDEDDWGYGDGEASAHGWFTRAEMKNMDLHPGFAQSLKKVTSAMRKGAPFAGYEDFDECTEKNSDKDDPDAYCGEIKHRAEGSLQSSLPSIEIEAVRYDKPTDHPFFKDVPLHPQHIIDAYDESDAPTKAQGMRWYSDGYHVAKALDPDGDAHRGAGVLAAYSPRSNWPINLFNASRSLQQRRAVRIGEGMNVMGNHAKAAAKILEDGKHYSEAFTTPKITDFAHLLAHGGDDQECETCAPHKKPDHPEQRVVVDRHALSAAAGRRMTDNDLGRAPLGTRKFYEHVADQYRTAAQRISDRDGVTVHPHQLQAITWLQQQKRNAAQEQGEAATDPKAKGRITREKNAWTKWEEHSRQHHPEFHTGDEEANMHLRNPHAGMRSSLPRVADLSDEEIQRGLGLPTSEQGHQDIKHQKAKDLAEHLIAPLYEPHGGHENYLLHMDNESMQHLQKRYRGGTGRFAFDEEAEAEGERAEPYYEIKHTTPQGRHTGWSIRHYADGPYAEIRHDATPGEGHDMIDIGRPLEPHMGPGSRHQPPDDFGHNELAAELHHWVNDSESGMREHLEGPYGDARIRRHKQRYPQGKLPPRQSSLPRLAYGETRAPADVDTLRTESCPVCGETDAFDGDRCQVCNFIQPPSMFTDPDTGVARQMDLRKDEMGQQTQVGPDGQPLPGQEGVDPNDPTGQDPAMEGLPGQAGDQIADLFCPACGFSADTQEPMTNNDPAMPSEQQGLQEGDVCPNCGQATMLSPNDVGEMGGEVPQEIADDADADGMPDDQEPDVDEDGIPDDTEPDEDADGRPDDSENDEDQDEVPDDADPDDDGDGEADAVEDEDEAPKGRKDNARRV